MENRSVNELSDNQPSIHHFFEKELIYRYIKDKRVLDIGCWTGQFLSIIENIADTYGLEPNSTAVKFAKKNRKGKYYRGNALKLPFKNGFFDVVTLWDVIEHLPNRTEEQAISEIYRILKDNGILALSTVTTHPLSIFLDPAFFLLGHRHYSYKKLSTYLQENNFSVEKVIYSGGIWTLLNDNINLLFKHIFKKRNKFEQLDKLVEKEHLGKGFVEIHLVCRKLSS